MTAITSVFLAALAWLSCAAPPEAAAPQAELLQTGRPCAPAAYSCEPGRCVATIDNQCDLPVTCQLRIESQCQTSAGEVGPATASTKQVTQLAKTSNALEAATNCGQGAPVSTTVVALECI